MAETVRAFEFNEEQERGIAEVLHWYKGWHQKRHRKQVFFLAGFAGTGKTSVAQEIARRIAEYLYKKPNQCVIFIAPTGKAASRLRQKGCPNARTLHQFVYNVRGEDADGDPIFIGKGALEDKPSLIIMDEASMIGQHDNRTVTQHGIPVLAMGDIGQVDPVKDVAAYTESNIDYSLTQIMRQEADSNIIRASMFIRQGKRLPPKEYHDVKVLARSPNVDDFVKHSGEDAQIICSYNNTRVEVNTKVRKALGFTADLPQEGEKIVCMFNQHGYGFMNGEQGIVICYEEVRDEDRADDDEHGMLVRIKSLTDGTEKVVKFNPLSFDKDEKVRKEAMKTPGGFDYGYALTIHKSQGSEWPNVLVIEELMGNYAKLMYTAITRAQTHLTIFRSNR